jgi:arsenate reductase (thioredoxin)
MAEAFANYYGKGRVSASSAGNKIVDKIINPVVVKVMKEKGIYISTEKPKMLTFEMANNADLVVTMGCNDNGVCPGPSLKKTLTGNWRTPKANL